MTKISKHTLCFKKIYAKETLKEASKIRFRGVKLIVSLIQQFCLS